MKKSIWIASGYLVIMLVAAVVNALTVPNMIMKNFSSYLDKEGFVSGMDREAFLDFVKDYQYQGKSVVEEMMYEDEPDRSGVWGGIKGCFVYNLSTIEETEKGKQVSIRNSLHVRVPLEGLEQPFGIPFGATMTEALQKMGIHTDPYEILDLGPKKYGTKTLYETGSETLTLWREEWSPLDPGGHPDYHFRLVYAEKTYDGDDVVTRSMAMEFDRENDLFYVLELGVSETYYMDP